FDISGIGPHFVMSRWLVHLRQSSADDTCAAHFVSATVQEELVGNLALEPRAGGEVLLDALFVEPAWIGRDVGRELFEHAIEVSLKLGASRLVAVADPNVADFYRRMGARFEGEV